MPVRLRPRAPEFVAVKILAVQTANPRFTSLKDIKDLEAHSSHLLKEMAHFFKVYKDLQGKTVEVMDWAGAEEARVEIEKARATYAKEQH